MKLEEIQSCIAEYQDFIANCTDADFGLYFESADYCDLVNKSFSSFPNENLNLFLGIKDSKLMGFLINENIDYTEWTEEMQIFASEFKQFSEVGYNAFRTFYEKKDTPDSSLAVDSSEGFARIESWAANKFKWFVDNAANRTLVKFFEIPVEDYTNGHGNTFNLGLLSNGQIDVIVGTPLGLYDTSRPVPPFSPPF